jgi:hypothetical protein
LSRLLSFIIALFLPNWVPKSAAVQACSSKETAPAAGPEAALVVAQVVTCDIAADAKQLQPSGNNSKARSSGPPQDVDALQQLLLSTKQEAAAACSKAEQGTTEAQQKLVVLEELYQQVGVVAPRCCIAVGAS